MRRATLFFFFALALRAASPCPTPVDTPSGSTLDQLAAKYLGSSEYATAIALATNLRTDQQFPYISNPYDISGIARVCVPNKAEAKELNRAWAAYEKAVESARLMRQTIASKPLLNVAPEKPVDLVAWMRKDQADRLKTPSGGWIETAQSEMWVTLEPHLQQLCQAFVRDRGPDERKLTARLEQRLGLAPASNKAIFVRIRLDKPGADTMFRPCSDPAVDSANCAAGPPPADAPNNYAPWFYQQYYGSYGRSLMSEFPWTARGYTFDWAAAPNNKKSFERVGESEFVIRKGAAIWIVEVMPTAQYCRP
jgi:hypothetical protein